MFSKRVLINQDVQRRLAVKDVSATGATNTDDSTPDVVQDTVVVEDEDLDSEDLNKIRRATQEKFRGDFLNRMSEWRSADSTTTPVKIDKKTTTKKTRKRDDADDDHCSSGSDWEGQTPDESDTETETEEYSEEEVENEKPVIKRRQVITSTATTAAKRVRNPRGGIPHVVLRCAKDTQEQIKQTYDQSGQFLHISGYRGRVEFTTLPRAVQDRWMAHLNKQEKERKYHEKNRESIKERKRKYYEKNRELRKTRAKNG